MKTAKFVKDVSGFTGIAKLYRVMDDFKGELFIVVSATSYMDGRPETYIFESNKEGEVINWLELDGSTKGTLSHEEALENGGYELICTLQ